MHKWIAFFIAVAAQMALASDNQTIGFEFSGVDCNRTIRSTTPIEGNSGSILNQRRPIRNPHIMSEVVWVDRNHEFAIAENVTVTPDGSGIFAGWWLNNQRYASYASAGLDIPIWRYNQPTQWMMPVDASDTKYAGTGAQLPIFIWGHDSPLPAEEILPPVGYNNASVSFSGDGNFLAFVSAVGTEDGLLTIYDVAAADTIFTRSFLPVSGLYGVDLSYDGSVVVVSAYSQLYVYDVPAGNLRDVLFNYSQGTAKVNSDGSLIVNGTYSGLVYLYEWNGSSYDYRWVKQTGHDWVTAVDIANNGSVFACGTLDFENNQIAGGKFMSWDANTGNELIDYEEYGDMVASVAISADGEYAIAGSWGQYGTTFGDVVSCFVRQSNVPIFQLLDDVDEPGSVFAVAISDSGHYAAAGGKAVHAREFGNGGMLYSIKIRDPLTNDIAVASIDEPDEFIVPGEAVIPTATYINVGTSPATFAAACSVFSIDNGQLVYSSGANIANLPSFATSQVFFSPDFTMPGDGGFRMIFSALMAGDQDTANNNLALIVRSWHDLQGVSVTSPFDEVTVYWPCAPIATFKNFGSYTETVDILLSIRDSTDVEIFAAIGTIFDMAPYAQEEIQLDGWVPAATGSYRAIFTADLQGDRFPNDNTIERGFRVVEEMIYDDGLTDAAYWVDSYPSSWNRKFAQRFEPNLIAPFTITNARFFQPNITYAGNFDYLGITKEIDGLPDTAEYYVIEPNPFLPGPNNWASYDFNFSLDSSAPLWLVLHWADTPDYGPFIGADNTGIVQQQSYWYSDNNPNGWNQWLFNDWMIRMTLRTGTGVESDIVSGLPERISLGQNYPNPFNPTTNIQFGLPNPDNVRITIFNTLGQKVRTLANSYFDAGYHLVTWNGRADDGSEVTSGAYYYRFEAGNIRISKKMLVVK